MNRKKIAFILFLLPISGFFMYPFVSGFAVIMGILSAVLAIVFCLFTIGADLMMVLEFMGVIG